MTRLAPKAAVFALCALTPGRLHLAVPKAKPAQLYRFGNVAPPTAAQPVEARMAVRLGAIGFVSAAAGDRMLTTNGEQAAYLAGGRWVSPAAVLFEVRGDPDLRRPTGTGADWSPAGNWRPAPTR